MKDVLVLGATSAIAQAVCRRCAAGGTRFWLLGRSEERLAIVAEDLRARGAGAVTTRAFAANDFVRLRAAIEEGFQQQGHFDLFLAAQGAMPEQAELERDPENVADFFQSSVVALMQAALLVGAHFERQGGGACVIVGSVAGDRGRLSNYVYGSGKAALETFCDGLSQRLSPAAHVMLVKPGPVDTPMTAHLKKSGLFTTPDKVAAAILRGLERGATVIYAPFYWRWIMAVVSRLPRGMVKRLKA